MNTFKMKPNHAPVKAYYETLRRLANGKFENEGNIRRAFESLLEKCARPYEWYVVGEYPITRTGKNPLKVDAAILDAFNIPRGYWEAKDEKDDLTVEMNKKFGDGYPRTNILFQKPTQAILVQDGRIVFNGEISDGEKLVDVLKLFFEWRQPHQEDWERAVREFEDRIPEIAKGALKLINEERKTNKVFVERFAAFAEVCRESINPELKDEAVEEMLVQHLLTERIFRRIFNNPEFTRRNVIAAEIEKVIDSLTKKHFSRDSFLHDLDPFYKAIEETAANASDYTEKQAFLNKIYERFFQGFNTKQADTHGIVYTPQPIVDFMVRSVNAILKSEFSKNLSDRNVHVLDPFVGTGNFITRIMHEIRTSSLPQKYSTELHCNEVMLLPYYIASMNIEHAYLERVGEYEPFEGICLVDTFELAEPKQAGFEFMSEGNTERIRRQKRAPIFVVIGNPPYNVGQVNENDQNKNRKYKHIDTRVRETYTKKSKATLRSKLSDPYVKAFRLASDRIRLGGMIAFVSNNSFIDQLAFDGMRYHLSHDFDKIYVLDLGGNVRKNPKLSGTTHNVFGIQVGVSITFLIKNEKHDIKKAGEIYYASVGEDWKKEQKYGQLNDWEDLNGVEWQKLTPDVDNTWLTEGQSSEFSKNIPIGSKLSKGRSKSQTIFNFYSLGVSTNRDADVYDFNKSNLRNKVNKFINNYCIEMDRYIHAGRPEDIDNFVNYDMLQWSRNLKRHFKCMDRPAYSDSSIYASMYRPYTQQFIYLQDILVDEPSKTAQYIFGENVLIAISGISGNKPFQCLATNRIVDLHCTGDTQCFPFYTYDEDNANKHENITDWCLEEFRKQYANKKITKWDIFHFTYGILHHPEYRTRYAANLKRELPRIPKAPEFKEYARIGAALMKLHVEYEKQKEYPLERIEKGKLNWRVEKMVFSKDKTQLYYNDFLTFSEIPLEVYEYRLGNRSALEWVVDQYQVSTDKRSGIVNDPNREDDPEYIVRLIGQIVTVSVETVKLVNELSILSIDEV